ncbi:MAG: hypothetical protein AAGA42_17225 [Actinomycetota bacterium]
MNGDPFDGLDADERAEAEAVGSGDDAGSRAAHPSARRAIWILGFFVLAYVPIVLGATRLVNTVVYEPICERKGDVVAIQRLSTDPTGDGERAACRYADGSEIPVADLIGSTQDFLLSIFDLAFRFVVPFVVVYLVVRLFPPKRPT